MKISFRWQQKTKVPYNVVPTRRTCEKIMTLAYQLDFFENNDPVTILQKDFRLLDKKCQNVQRGLFARFGTLEEKLEMIRDLCFQQRVEIETLKAKLEVKAEIIEFPNKDVKC